MPHTNAKNNQKFLLKPLALATLMAGALVQPLLPAFAATTAGQSISNTATATYTDGESNSYSSVSNTVEITVAEIAGIEAKPAGAQDVNGGSYEGNDTIRFTFNVYNTGNDSTDVRIPSPKELYDAGLTKNFNPTEIRVYDKGDTPVFTAGSENQLGSVNEASGAQTYQGDLGGTKLLPGESFKVVIIGTIEQPAGGLNAGDQVSVTLGNTGSNDNSASTQNQVADAAITNLQTVDLGDPVDPLAPTANEDNTPGVPVDTREASASQYVEFGTEQRPLALATIKKTAANVDPGDTGAANDDVITYNLDLTVEDTSSDGRFIAEDLDSTPITLNTGIEDAILVSDTIPDGTIFEAATAPTGWDVVYSYDDPNSTVPVNNSSGLAAAEWTRTAPSADQKSLVKRVGYIYTTGTITAGTTVTGFELQVITADLPAAGDDVYNIAQVFGTTYNAPGTPDPVDQVVYDESGDSQPNNFENGTSSTPDGSNFDPNEDTGIADPDTDGTDPGGNTGTGPNGEVTAVTITGEELSGTDNILNGPNGQPGAVGPTDDNDDYTNKAYVDGGNAEFTNTVQNPSTSSQRIDNVTVQPLSPTQAEAADDDGTTGQYGTNTDIPANTRVTLTNAANTRYATYQYDGSVWQPVESGTISGGVSTPDGSFTPLNLGTILVGASTNYKVDVDFSGVADNAIPDNIGVSIPIVAFPDTNSDGYVNETLNNISINRIYTGFMELNKEARILDASGNIVQNWTADPTILDGKLVEPGYVIEYRIRYENISTTPSGSGNVSLTAKSFQILEDGDATFTGRGPDDIQGTADDAPTTNSWADSTTHKAGTSASAGSIRYFKAYVNATNNTPIGTADPADAADVEAYINVVGDVAPGGQGSFIIRRTVLE